MAFRFKRTPSPEIRQFDKPLSLREELSSRPAADAIADSRLPFAVVPGGVPLTLRLAARETGAGYSLLELRQAEGGPLPPFRPGQVISLFLTDGTAVYSRAYTLCGTVADALLGSYFITVRDRGRFAPGLLADCQVGDLLQAAGPWGDFAYLPPRDGQQILALAEEGGVLSFLALARELAAEKEQDDGARLILVVQARRAADLLYKEELTHLAELSPRLQVCWWLSEEKAPGCMYGSVNRNVLAAYLAEEPSCLLISGSRAFCSDIYSFCGQMWPQLKQPPRSIQHRPIPAAHQPWSWPQYPASARDQVFQLTVRQWDRTYTLPAPSSRTLLDSLQEAGVPAPARCRGGECGFCRARLLTGQIFLPPDEDHRRRADGEAGFVHPCCAYPLSDIELLLNGDPAREQTPTAPGAEVRSRRSDDEK